MAQLRTKALEIPEWTEGPGYKTLKRYAEYGMCFEWERWRQPAHLISRGHSLNNPASYSLFGCSAALLIGSETYQQLISFSPLKNINPT